MDDPRWHGASRGAPERDGRYLAGKRAFHEDILASSNPFDCVRQPHSYAAWRDGWFGNRRPENMTTLPQLRLPL